MARALRSVSRASRAGRTRPFFHIFEALADKFRNVGLRRYIQQPLIGFGILHDRFGLSVDGKNQRFSRLFQMFQEFRRIAANCRHGLNVFFYFEHDGLGFCDHSTFTGV
jgi:hypothetical protein